MPDDIKIKENVKVALKNSINLTGQEVSPAVVTPEIETKAKVSSHFLNSYFTTEDTLKNYQGQLELNFFNAEGDITDITKSKKVLGDRTIEKLTPQQRELCRLLGEEGLSVSEASELLNTPRSTLYDDIKRIKAIFQQDNLHEYLD